MVSADSSAILFRVAPNGAGDLEDLSVLDEADTSTWLVHAVVIDGNDLIVFRHVVCKEHATQLPPESTPRPGPPPVPAKPNSDKTSE